jgi:hypothetical protein
MTSPHAVFAYQPDRARLRPLVPCPLGERHPCADRKPEKGAIGHAVLPKVDFPIIDGFEEAKASATLPKMLMADDDEIGSARQPQ